MTHFEMKDFKLGMIIEYVDMNPDLNGTHNIITKICEHGADTRRVVTYGFGIPVHQSGHFEVPILKTKIKIIQE